VNGVEQTDEEDSESEWESEMSSSECEMSEEETFRSINRVWDRICDSVVKWVLLSLMNCSLSRFN
jgi:hypothetical protein